jgi:cytosine/uracil/thiamine/allantoin permease
MTRIHQPPDALAAPRFTGPRTFARLPHRPTLEDVDCAIYGMPWDGGTTFRSGARFGPEAIRSASGMIRTFATVFGVLVAFIQPDSFATSFDNWIVSIVVWISPWAGITLVEYYLLRRGRVDVPPLYEPPDRSPYGDVNWRAIVALVVGLAAGWAWEYGLVGPLQGPIAKALGNTDFSWAAGMVVAGGLYWVLAADRVRRTTPDSVAAS